MIKRILTNTYRVAANITEYDSKLIFLRIMIAKYIMQLFHVRNEYKMSKSTHRLFGHSHSMYISLSVSV